MLCFMYVFAASFVTLYAQRCFQPQMSAAAATVSCSAAFYAFLYLAAVSTGTPAAMFQLPVRGCCLFLCMSRCHDGEAPAPWRPVSSSFSFSPGACCQRLPCASSPALPNPSEGFPEAFQARFSFTRISPGVHPGFTRIQEWILEFHFHFQFRRQM